MDRISKYGSFTFNYNGAIKGERSATAVKQQPLRWEWVEYEFITSAFCKYMQKTFSLSPLPQNQTAN